MHHTILLLVAIVAPMTVNAQSAEAPLPVHTSKIVSLPDIERTLNGSVNIHIHQLSIRTTFYKHLNDTVAIKKPKHLQAGALVVVRATNKSWLRVSRAESPTQLGSDTTSFYIPKIALRGAKTFVIL